MKKIILFISILLISIIISAFNNNNSAFYNNNTIESNPTYVGTQACVCHVSILQSWKMTGHAQIQQYPGPGTITAGNWNSTISMGSTFGNATVTLSIVGGVYKATLNPTSGSPVTYDVVYTMGYNWRQYYLTKIGTSTYRLPFEWEYEEYKNPTTGNFQVASSTSSYFTSTGTLKPIDNTFRRGSWDRGCARCHTTGGQVVKTVNNPDTSWTINLPNIDTINAKVGCEDCHGPGSDHISAPSVNNIFGPTRMNSAGLQRKQEVCGQCHFRASSTNMTYGFPWKESVDSGYMVGNPLINYIDPNWKAKTNLTGGPSTWPDTMTKRAYRQQWNEMQVSGHKHNQYITCTNCHNQHASTPYEYALKFNPDNNDICLQCHNNFGSVGNPNIASITAHTKHLYDPTNQNQTGGASRCVACHVAATGNNWNTQIYDVHSHTFWAIPPIKTLQKFNITSPTFGMLNSCAVSCHRNPSSASGTSNVPTLGVGYDSTLLNWRQPTDSLLADTLNRWYSRQIWTVGIKEISTEVPDGFKLSQNYPNPFNPSTQIIFSVSKTEFVSIKIYDIMGREIYTLVGERLSPGKYNINWTSVNNEGDYVASGVYFYRMVAGNYIESKRMILLR